MCTLARLTKLDRGFHQLNKGETYSHAGRQQHEREHVTCAAQQHYCAAAGAGHGSNCSEHF